MIIYANIWIISNIQPICLLYSFVIYETRCDHHISSGWYNRPSTIVSRSRMFFFKESINIKSISISLFLLQFLQSLFTLGLENNICGNKKPEGVFTVGARFLKIVYSFTGSQSSSIIFTIIITAFRDGNF